MMNYPTFLKKVDALTSRCDANSLRLFVHEVARTLQENSRERFLLTLEDFCDATESDSIRISKDDNLEKRVDEILRALSGIQDGDRALEAEYNESWDDWSDEEEGEYEFSDPDNLLDRPKGNGPGKAASVSKAMDGCSFDRAEYCMGMNAIEEVEAKELFEDCFGQWKESVTVDELQCDAWIKRLERWISLRVSAIMAANRRNYYGECAAYIAAFGEMLQSRGTADAKESVMQRYRKEYSRRRAFHEELREYGMKS